MPEEKVSATQGTCEVEDAPHMNHDGRGWLKVPHSKMNSCIMWRPAADAGPRQPKLCPTCLRGEETRFPTATCTDKWHNAPPVPQESAPKTCLKCGKPMADTQVRCLFCDAYEPAPDSAMRVARLAWEKLIRIYCKAEYRPLLDDVHIAEIAALIREAGSERERELTRRLQITLADIDTLLEIADSNVHPKVLDMIKLSRAEASRLLGGESK